MDFKVTMMRQYTTPFVIAGLVVGMVPSKRDDVDEPHTHSEAQEPLNAVGRASVEAYTTSTSAGSLWSPALSSDLELARIPVGRLISYR